MASAALPVSGVPVIGLIEPRSVSTYHLMQSYPLLTRVARDLGARWWWSAEPGPTGW